MNIFDEKKFDERLKYEKNEEPQTVILNFLENLLEEDKEPYYETTFTL